MKMVITRGKKKTGSSNKRPEAKEDAENGSAETRSSGWLTEDMVETNEDTQLEDEVDLVTDKEENANSGKMSGEEGEKATDRDNEDPSTPVTKSMFDAYDDEEEADSEENTSEDGEQDDQEDMLFEDNEEHIEHDDEERAIDEYELSEEEASEQNDVDEVSGEEATEEDEVSSEEATAVENDEENNQEGKENAKQDTREAKATEDGQETKEHDREKLEASLKDIKKPSEGSIKKKVQAARLKKADSEDKPKSSSKRELKKRPSPQSVKAHVKFSSRNGDRFTGEEAREEDAVTEENKGEKENAKQDTRGAKATEYGRETKEKLEASLKNINKPSEGSIKKEVQVGKLKKVDYKPESSQKRKVKKRRESMGMIFMCNAETKKDCHQYRVFGLPESKKDIVEKIYTGMRLFLYDIDKKLMHGIYKAAGPGGYNIEPKAFNSQYPSQVRFKLMEKCTPLAEEKFKTVIKQNYFTKTKFDCQLNSEQVRKLCRLFIASKGRPLQKMGRSLKAEKHPVRQERNIRQRAGDKRRLPLREQVRLHERPRKRVRRVVSPAAAPRYRIPAPVVDPYRRERHSPHRERRDRPLTPLDPYGGLRERGRDPPPPRDERYRDGRDPRLEDHYAYRGSRDSRLVDRRDPYVDEADTYSRRRDRYTDSLLTYLEPHDPYRAGQEAYLVRRDSYRDSERDRRSPYIESRDPYRDSRSSYLEHRVPYAETAQPELYSSYRRPALPDNRDAFREERAVDLHDTYRRDELLARRELPLLDSETRTHHELAGRDAYVSIRERPSYAEHLYPSAYSSRAAVYRL